MRVHIHRYRDNWIGPYAILKKINYQSPRIHRLAGRLMPFCNWLFRFRNRWFSTNTVKVHVTFDDIVHADQTLAFVILPVLKLYRLNVSNFPIIDESDLPNELRAIREEIGVNDDDSSSIVVDAAYSEEDCDVEDDETGTVILHHDGFFDKEMMYHRRSPSNEELGIHQWCWILDEMIWTFETIISDEMHYDRVRVCNGLRLFGKYYMNLWI